MEEKLLNYIQREPKARERKNKNRAIGNMLIEKYSLDIPKDKMADIVGDALSLDRYWRLILKNNPDLRGTDYEDRVDLEVDKQRELGYNL